MRSTPRRHQRQSFAAVNSMTSSSLTRGEQNIVIGILSNRGDLATSLRLHRLPDTRCRKNTVLTLVDEFLPNDRDSGCESAHDILKWRTRRDVRSHVDAWRVGKVTSQSTSRDRITLYTVDDCIRQQPNSRKPCQRSIIFDDEIDCSKPASNQRLSFIRQQPPSHSSMRMLRPTCEQCKKHGSIGINKMLLQMGFNSNMIGYGLEKDYSTRPYTINVYLPKIDTE